MNYKDTFLLKEDWPHMKTELKTELIKEMKEIFLTKDDKVQIMRSVYFVGLTQFLAMMASIAMLLSFLLKR